MFKGSPEAPKNKLAGRNLEDKVRVLSGNSSETKAAPCANLYYAAPPPSILYSRLCYIGPHRLAKWETLLGGQREVIHRPPPEKALLDLLPWGPALVPAMAEARGSEQVGVALLPRRRQGREE